MTCQPQRRTRPGMASRELAVSSQASYPTKVGMDACPPVLLLYERRREGLTDEEHDERIASRQRFRSDES
jgi:hypothetical protein